MSFETEMKVREEYHLFKGEVRHMLRRADDFLCNIDKSLKQINRKLDAIKDAGTETCANNHSRMT